MVGGAPRYLIVDDFLPAPVVAQLLGHALAHEADFVPTGVAREGSDVVDRQDRQSLRCCTGLGPIKSAFVDSIHARFAEFGAATGLSPFALAETETELTAHGDGHFYNLHVDSFTQANRAAQATDRMLSSVFYFHGAPQGFSGGELALHPFGGGEPVLIEPRHNRLVLFASISPHAVRPIVCPSGTFADSRFAVNCWLHRAKPRVQ